MAPTLPRDIVVRIKEETDIVGVVRGYVTLKPAGAGFKALCPFHREKTPSFTVNPARQLFKCYGCGEGGDVISFLMKIEGLTFPETVETLARSLDLDLSRYLVEDEAEGERQAFHRANEAAAAHWREMLLASAGADARRYLEERGFAPAICERFEVGWAAAGGGGLVAALERAGVAADLALRSGLLMRRGAEAPFAYFRSRIIFPIRNLAQRVAGFGGRVLGPGEPKYLNSPDSTYFSKGKLLYGFSASRIAAARLKTAILVEGYFDLMALAQAGFANGVATCGTAFTPDQARLLRRGSPAVVLLFDGDRAGLKAAVRACHTALAAGLEPRVARLPAGEDPASLLQRHAAQDLRAVLEQAPAYLPLLRQLVDERGDRRVDRERALKQGLASIALVADPIRQAFLLEEAAQLFGLRLAVLEAELARLTAAPLRAGRGAEAAPPTAPTPPAAPPVPAGLDRGAIEREILAHALRDASGRAAELLLELRGELPAAEPLGERLLADLLAWRRRRQAGEETAPAVWAQANMNLRGDDYRRYLAGLLDDERVPDHTDFARAVRDGHDRLRADEERQRRLEAARGGVAAAGGAPAAGSRPS